MTRSGWLQEGEKEIVEMVILFGLLVILPVGNRLPLIFGKSVAVVFMEKDELFPYGAVFIKGNAAAHGVGAAGAGTVSIDPAACRADKGTTGPPVVNHRQVYLGGEIVGAEFYDGITLQEVVCVKRQRLPQSDDIIGA